MRTGLGDSAAGAPADRHRGCCSASDAGDARFVAGKLGIHFYALNFQEDFNALVDYFAGEYTRGRTPNPCVVCNQQLKFGRIVEYADAIGAGWIATGHYARLGVRSGRPILRQAADADKDQSYVLYGLRRDLLDRLRFPLGDLTKQQVRAEARRFNLPVADKPESVDICFVPDRDYSAVVRQRRPEAFQPGPILDRDGRQVGIHEGIGHYTVGQRRGMGLALGLPVYVTRVDGATRTLTIGPREDLLSRGLIADGVNWLCDAPGGPIRVQARIRYRHRPAPARAWMDGATLCVCFEEPQAAVTPGQAVVLYDGDDCLGGGWIRESSEFRSSSSE
jgi:tRNA-specific 2-thiouridylase